jgi:hypothetical protein
MPIYKCVISEVPLRRIDKSGWGGFEYLKDPKCYADGSLATGRVTHARQDEGERRDKARCPGPPGWGFWVQGNNLFQ